MQVDLQQYLADMRREQREDLSQMRQEQKRDLKELSDTVTEKVDAVLVKINDHETRLVVMENTRKSLRWLGAAIVVAILPVIFDVLLNHVPRLLASR